jgi:hypothetical protein
VCLFEEVDALLAPRRGEAGPLRKRRRLTRSNTIVDEPERRLIEGNGGKAEVLPVVPGRSTSNAMAKLARRVEPGRLAGNQWRQASRLL